MQKTRRRKLSEKEQLKFGEFKHFESIIDNHQHGILSIVSDTWDLWIVCTDFLPRLKDKIMSKDIKIVIRPDSGDPVDILCGLEGSYDVTQNTNGPAHKGVIELLWDVFGGTVSEKGYKLLDAHIGAIYGDSITLDRADKICDRLKKKGFASTNVVLGIGSYTYQYNTRDTFGFAVKATYTEVGGECREIFKDPITDDGTKRSAKGLMAVFHGPTGRLEKNDQVDWATERKGELKEVFRDGKLLVDSTLQEIRDRLYPKK